jgi:hypothetical protein
MILAVSVSDTSPEVDERGGQRREEYQRPESKSIQQLAEPDEVCKTSIPRSNPGGARQFFCNRSSLILFRSP